MLEDLSSLISGIAAGVILTSGIAFASLSLDKKSTAGIKAQMKPLTSQQEAILLSEKRDEVYQAADKCNSVTLDENDVMRFKSLSGSECKTGTQSSESSSVGSVHESSSHKSNIAVSTPTSSEQTTFELNETANSLESLHGNAPYPNGVSETLAALQVLKPFLT